MLIQYKLKIITGGKPIFHLQNQVRRNLVKFIGEGRNVIFITMVLNKKTNLVGEIHFVRKRVPKSSESVLN